jgi:hypothetical protein
MVYMYKEHSTQQPAKTNVHECTHIFFYFAANRPICSLSESDPHKVLQQTDLSEFNKITLHPLTEFAVIFNTNSEV